MRSVNLVLNILIIIIVPHCAGQFHQDDYDILQDRILTNDYNKNVVKDLVVVVFKYNDTLEMKAINISVTMLQEIKEKATLKILVYKLVSEEYRVFPFNVTIDLCEEYKNLGPRNPFGIKTAVEISNFRGCPVAKNKHLQLLNWILEQEKFPPHLPPGKYSLKITIWMDDDVFVFDGNWYGELVSKGRKKKQQKRRRH